MTKSEKLFSLIISLLITYLVYYVSNHYCVKINSQKFFELFITTFSIIIGFLLTISTLLQSISNPNIEFIRKSDGINSLNNSLKESIYSGFIAVIFSIFTFLFEELIKCYPQFIYIGIFLNILAFIICFNFLKTFLKIMSP
jgi:hypothetical protein